MPDSRRPGPGSAADRERALIAVAEAGRPRPAGEAVQRGEFRSGSAPRSDPGAQADHRQPGRSGPVVVLVGPPGAGKSSVGGAVARLTGLTLRDTDSDIEASTGRTIPDIFLEDGEIHFRALERAAVATALAEHTGVLALGGGAVLAPETRSLLAGHPVVFLNLSMATGVRRTGLGANRPLLAGVNPRATYKTLLDARLGWYREVAVHEVLTDQLTVADVARVIVDRLGLQ